MAPEQFYARTPVASADQYALAVVVYQCLTGTLPFIGDSFEEVARRQAREVAPPLADSRRDLPATVTEAVDRALSKQPADRFPSVLDFVTALGATPAPPDKRSTLGRRASPGLRKSAEPPVLVVEPETPARGGRWKFALLALATVGVGAAYVLGDRVVSLWRAEASLSGDAAAAGTAAPITAQTAEAPGAADTTEAPGLPPVAPAGSSAPAERSTMLQTPPAPRAAAERAPPATLLVSASPWGQLFIDGVLVGNTPKANIPLSPGRRLVRITREGYEPFERELMVEPGQVIRLTGIVLRPRGS
jgi:serine/threonine-protein kinase